jgi:phytol kinase
MACSLHYPLTETIMEYIATVSNSIGRRNIRSVSEELQIELLRKGIHLLIAFVPVIASLNLGLAVGLLSCGVLFYAACERLRLGGYIVPVISRVTTLAARRRDGKGYVLGPITLGLGALLSLLLYPDPAASLAIYALAFGDGLSSLVGKTFGSLRIPFTGGKSLEGSLTCLVAVFVASNAVTGNAPKSLAIAVAAMVIEAAPTKDLDNIILPVSVGAIAVLLFG